MSLQKSSGEILQQLVGLIDQLSEKQYALPIEVMSNSTVGKHVRHIVEFYECLLNGVHSATVDYDARLRNPLLETDPYFSVQVILDINKKISEVKSDRRLKLRLDLSVNDGMEEMLDTTFLRELAYNIEHAIHHMAIIKMGVMSHYPRVMIDHNFGVAYSTIRHKERIEERVPSVIH